MALWDLVARRAGIALHRLLGSQRSADVAVYASGLNPDRPDRLAAAKQADGFGAFKLKIGFGRERDLANLRAVRAAVGEAATLMADANQAWSLETALEMCRALDPVQLGWIEEPIIATSSADEWRQLKEATPIPLAAGENMRGAEFDDAIAHGFLAVLQPDVGKWGGISGCLPVGRRARQAGMRLCPHWLGGGIGLMASLHLAAAIGGDGMVEVDANPNPLRELLASPFPEVAGGRMNLPGGPGLGVTPDLNALLTYQAFHATAA